MRIAVGAITRQRETMFSKLLDSLADMDLPQGAEIAFVFAENDTVQRVQSTVDDFRTRVGMDVTLLLERSPGIPLARNAVLDYARDAGFDYLTFVDDDGIVAKDWLVKLMDGMIARDLDLAGGPVVPVADEPPQTLSQRAAFGLFSSRASKRNKRRARSELNHSGRPHGLYTGNWCVKLKTAKELDHRFDDGMRFSGGSDADFCLRFQDKGAKTGWIADAIVDDVLPMRRLTLGYVYSRARDQCTNAAMLRSKDKVKVLLGTLPVALAASVLLIAAPIAGVNTLGSAVFKFGLVAGRLNYVFGRGSTHYAPGTESVHTEVSG